MGVVEHSSGAVESCLSAIEESYGGFSVNQTTIPVPADQYEQERERTSNGRVDLYAKVRNTDDEVLHLTSGDDTRLPSATIDGTHTFEEAVCRTVRETAGVDCRVTGVEEVTILGVCHAEDDDKDAVRRLAVVFEATHEEGTIAEDAAWRAPGEEVQPVYI
jgi:ADP-ribose pyrophosphatase YjhB (NUDIX family)